MSTRLGENDILRELREFGPTIVAFWCPACEHAHAIHVKTTPEKDSRYPNAWHWNGNADRPTFSPSLLVSGMTGNLSCHCIVADGYIKYLRDSQHDLANYTVPMIPWPEDVAEWALVRD